MFFENVHNMVFSFSTKINRIFEPVKHVIIIIPKPNCYFATRMFAQCEILKLRNL